MGRGEPALQDNQNQCSDIQFCGKYYFKHGLLAQLKLKVVIQKVNYGAAFFQG